MTQAILLFTYPMTSMPLVTLAARHDGFPVGNALSGLAASLFVVTASFLGLPISSIQCIVGGLSGVGLVGGIRHVQWLFLGEAAVGRVPVFVFLGGSFLCSMCSLHVLRVR